MSRKAKAPPYPVRKGGWPHPTFSRASANAFLEKSRPNDEELACLIGAFRPLPRRALPRKELVASFGHTIKATQVAFRLWETEARFRAMFLPDAIRVLQQMARWIADEMKAPVDRGARARRKLDTRDPHLSAAIGVALAAQKRGIDMPSDGELAALAVFARGDHGQPPTENDARRRAYWRTVRRRASTLLREVGPLVSDIHPAFLDAVKADALWWIRNGQQWSADMDELEREAGLRPASAAKSGGRP
ncbi:MAG TPA: hypothetical protein VEB43_04560 [Anaeromyxobacter sp.]|nr:hypothetical protein [Anaeromyxobacter sp.]